MSASMGAVPTLEPFTLYSNSTNSRRQAIEKTELLYKTQF